MEKKPTNVSMRPLQKVLKLMSTRYEIDGIDATCYGIDGIDATCYGIDGKAAKFVNL